jgi:hypothetical protein
VKYGAKDMVLKGSSIESERYLSNLHFYKEGTFNHRIMNTDRGGRRAVVEIQEYFPKWLKPYVHQLKVTMKEVEADKIEVIVMDSKQIEMQYDTESNLIVRIKNLIIPPQTEVVLSFGVRKIMMPFEDYPNDPNRGFNIP